jgi:hypothetical protein
MCRVPSAMCSGASSMFRVPFAMFREQSIHVLILNISGLGFESGSSCSVSYIWILAPGFNNIEIIYTKIDIICLIYDAGGYNFAALNLKHLNQVVINSKQNNYVTNWKRNCGL